MKIRRRVVLALAIVAGMIMTIAWAAGLVHVDAPASDGVLGVNVGTDAHYCSLEFWGFGGAFSCEAAQ